MSVVPISPDIDKFPTVSVSPEIFARHPDAVFWIGKVACGANQEGFSGYCDALGRFRANVYVHEKEYLTTDVLDPLGREFDEYDERSVQFIAVENEHENNPTARIVGSIRMITKDKPDDKYPIEKYFPELFVDNPIGVNSAEVSRFIASYPEDKHFMQHIVALSLMRAAILHAVREQVDDQYGIIEKPLFRILARIGIPMEQLGAPKEIPEQGGTLYPIRTRTQEIIDSITTDRTSKIMLRDFFLQELGNGGEGYYPAGLVGGTYE